MALCMSLLLGNTISLALVNSEFKFSYFPPWLMRTEGLLNGMRRGWKKNENSDECLFDYTNVCAISCPVNRMICLFLFDGKAFGSFSPAGEKMFHSVIEFCGFQFKNQFKLFLSSPNSNQRKVL